jgi:hypothetical protein
VKKNSRVNLTISLVIISGFVSACTGPSVTPPTAEPSASPEYFFYPNSSASRNLPVFENVLKETGAGAPGHNLQESIVALVDLGFDIEAITHTPVNSKIGEPADSVSLAVLFREKCLIAQFSNAWITTTVAEPIISGCLIGDAEAATISED